MSVCCQNTRPDRQVNINLRETKDSNRPWKRFSQSVCPSLFTQDCATRISSIPYRTCTSEVTTNSSLTKSASSRVFFGVSLKREDFVKRGVNILFPVDNIDLLDDTQDRIHSMARCLFRSSVRTMVTQSISRPPTKTKVNLNRKMSKILVSQFLWWNSEHKQERRRRRRRKSFQSGPVPSRFSYHTPVKIRSTSWHTGMRLYYSLYRHETNTGDWVKSKGIRKASFCIIKSLSSQTHGKTGSENLNPIGFLLFDPKIVQNSEKFNFRAKVLRDFTPYRTTRIEVLYWFRPEKENLQP